MNDRPLARLRGLSIVTLAALAAGLIAVFTIAPEEAVQGPVQKIFYVHVPSAWVAYLAYAVVLISSIAYLRSGSRRWDLLAHASAETGVVFTAVTLVSGMMWARPIWGTYWTWDPRLTLTFVLFLIYLGYLTFRATSTGEMTGRVAAVIGIAGFVTVPMVHFSVEWFRGLHPARTVVNPGEGPQLEPVMLYLLLAMLGVFTLLYTLLTSMRVALGGLRDQAEQADLARARSSSAASGQGP